jgi:hypothetical protein
MKKYSCSVSVGVLESKKYIVYANSESEAKSKVESAGYRLVYSSFSDKTYSMLDGYIDSKERDLGFYCIKAKNNTFMLENKTGLSYERI